jgi:hypothetical protein
MSGGVYLHDIFDHPGHGDVCGVGSVGVFVVQGSGKLDDAGRAESRGSGGDLHYHQLHEQLRRMHPAIRHGTVAAGTGVLPHAGSHAEREREWTSGIDGTGIVTGIACVVPIGVHLHNHRRGAQYRRVHAGRDPGSVHRHGGRGEIMRMGVLSRGNLAGLGATPTTSAGIFTANPAAPNGIEPGATCYDSSFSPGYVHGVSDVEYVLQTPFGYNVTTQLSAAEVACLAGQSLVASATGSASAAGSAVNPDASGTCPWYCSLPGMTSLLTSACNPLTCDSTSNSNTDACTATIGMSCPSLIVFGVAGLALFLLLSKK